jgi:hypothetical protein
VRRCRVQIINQSLAVLKVPLMVIVKLLLSVGS